jgi:predicted transcriptional regulator of viral defense system
MTAIPLPTQSQRALNLLRQNGLTRLSEFREAGITAATVSRLEASGAIRRVARGLYQLSDAEVSIHHTLAEAAKLVPNGVVCLTSSLAFHELTDRVPARVWLAIGSRDWQPQHRYPPMRFVRFPPHQMETGMEQQRIEGAVVKVFSVSKTLADLFRYRRTVGIDVALEGLRETLRQRKATPAAIAHQAAESGVWKVVEPYLTALTHG